MTDDLASKESVRPSQEVHLNPALKSWIENVIVPALVKKWISMSEADHAATNDHSLLPENQQ